MQPIRSLFLLISIIVIAQSQTWVGSYTVQPGCNGSGCCCFSGQLTVTSPSADLLNVSVAFTGDACGTLTNFQAIIPDPHAYNDSVTVSNNAPELTLELTLSPNSSIITAIDPQYVGCNGTAVKIGVVKNEAVEQYMNIYIPLVALSLLQLITNFAKI